jgi:exodeoxyribonuclease VII small subunit
MRMAGSPAQQEDTMAINSNAGATAPASFEEAMAELAQLVTQMEGGQLPLEASVAAYARGSELVKYCAAQLEKVESQVKVLEGDMLKPFSADGAGEGA